MKNLLSISFKISPLEYAKFLLASYYIKPTTIILATMGLYSLIMPALVAYGFLDHYNKGLYFSFPYALVLLFYPLIMTGLILLTRLRNTSLRQEMRYEFDDEGVHIQGENFKSDLSWSNFRGVRELAGFLVLKPSAREGYLVKKSVLGADEITYIKHKIAEAKGLGK
ncbi:YcxB family protein [Chitinophaga sancti]|uniref:YcxB family protein n=1 Tax=Chitinophaga sancti TaxID=1004 RepID=A0A1K1QY44_9BACT|nr:YcxB family protein [Chitinophaga sancti]WQD62079.1 YcxB family protein [Chitinophaga sancti]WQG92352.1 YcxB family protein [Chitinophaga sancti]SFW64866.1 YcxB-like protein [Chitinophaga sancti]